MGCQVTSQAVASAPSAAVQVAELRPGVAFSLALRLCLVISESSEGNLWGNKAAWF